MKRAALLIALVSWASASLAQETSIVLHGFSWHEGKRPDAQEFRSFNYGIGLRRDWYQFGVYKNSYDRTSVYALAEYTYHGVGAFAGVVTGYDHGVVAGGLLARWRFVTVRFMPKVSEKQSGAVAALEVSWSL